MTCFITGLSSHTELTLGNVIFFLESRCQNFFDDQFPTYLNVANYNQANIMNIFHLCKWIL